MEEEKVERVLDDSRVVTLKIAVDRKKGKRFC